jgi:hypothetical protein
MHNQSLKRSTRCAGPPARLEGDGKQRKGVGMASCQERRAVVQYQEGWEAIGNRYLQTSNVPPVALGAGGWQKAEGAGKAVCSVMGGPTEPMSAGGIGIGVVLDIYDALPSCAGCRRAAGSGGSLGWERW